ncbi:MAG: TrkH family potassium uptake protein [Duodenibacillus sp.]
MFRSLRYTLFPVLNITAPVLVVFAFVLLIPCLVSLFFEDGAHEGFVRAAAVSLATGIVFWLITRGDKRELLPRDGFLLATLIWVLIPVFASIPLFYGIEGITVTKAFFEAMSGTTTTCATALTGLDALPESINFWRCFLSWLGGMGILVLAVAILPLLGVGGAQVFKAETSGPMKEARLTPRIADTAKGLWAIYLLMSIACALAYRWAGMDTFDSILHTFTTVSLGGFSSHDASFAYWNSPMVETVTIVFILLCGTSFTLHFVAWKARSPLAYLKNAECLTWVGTCLATIAVVTGILYQSGFYADPWVALRKAAFNVASTISTTGFATDDFNVWPDPALWLMIIVTCFATCGGSTGGGVKMMRALILIKQIASQFKQTQHPKIVAPVTLQGSVIDSHVVISTLSFLMLWVSLLVFSGWLLMATGLDLKTALGTAVGCITNLGPGLGETGPNSNFAVLNDGQLWLCSFLMLFGRLELVTVFMLFTRSFWKS